MLIDWKTVAAELINFLLLVWLLNRFLFKPTLAIVKERDEKIRAELEDADRQKKEAHRERETLTEEKEAVTSQKSALLKTAVDEARQEKERLLRDAHNEYTSLRTTLHAHAEEDKKRLLSEFKETIEDEVFRLARTTLAGLSSISLEEQMVVQFAQRVHQMTPEDKQQILFDLERSSYAVTFRTAFLLSVPSKTLLETACRDLFGPSITCAFERDPSLMSGVEMVTTGHTVGWSIFSSLLAIREAV